MNTARSVYIAGIIDSDGHITWRGGKYQAPDVGVTNQSGPLMAYLQHHCGGSVALQRGIDDVGLGPISQDIYKWHLTGERACVLLRAIRPFLIVKATKADEVLSAYYLALDAMQRPARRHYHINKERAAMKIRGWD